MRSEGSLRLALLQAASCEGNTEAAVAALERPLRAAGAAGARMLVAPECWLPGYNARHLADLALPRGGAWQERLARLCRSAGTGLVLGYAERAGARLFNAALALDAEGNELAHYRKIQLWGPREQALFSPGDAYTTFDLQGRRAALLICYDVEFAPHVAALAARGASVILAPTANMLPFTHVARATVPAMAANHGIGMVYANYCGSEGDLGYAGGSVIVAADGEVLAAAGAAPALLIADLPPVPPERLSTQARDLRRID